MTKILDLEIGTKFTLDGVNYEVAEDWDGELPDTLECVDLDELRYTELNPYCQVKVIE